MGKFGKKGVIAALAVLVVGALVVGVSILGGEGAQPEFVPYVQFLEMVEAGEVARVVLSDSAEIEFFVHNYEYGFVTSN
ncbi:MAG: ATP-dependent metallopeptidase FtsH/Yme1/Tma family protein, partial [Defluviitaleaceae bacterium]|nr:ATP-dependent metallopeptidase FtsH/Yme1/Tma family protein [Defluviitaleaceae bacterium]